MFKIEANFECASLHHNSTFLQITELVYSELQEIYQAILYLYIH